MNRGVQIETVSEMLGAGGAKTLGAECAGCGRKELARLDERKTEFVRSLKMAGWKWKGGGWACWRCNERRQ